MEHELAALARRHVLNEEEIARLESALAERLRHRDSLREQMAQVVERERELDFAQREAQSRADWTASQMRVPDYVHAGKRWSSVHGTPAPSLVREIPEGERVQRLARVHTPAGPLAIQGESTTRLLDPDVTLTQLSKPIECPGIPVCLVVGEHQHFADGQIMGVETS